MPQGSLIAVGTTKVQANQTENTEDLLYSEVTYHEESDKFSFEMPADDIDLSVSTDQAENGIMGLFYAVYVLLHVIFMMQQILKQINITIIQMASFIRLIQLWDRVEMTATNMFVTKQAERLIQ